MNIDERYIKNLIFEKPGSFTFALFKPSPRLHDGRLSYFYNCLKECNIERSNPYKIDLSLIDVRFLYYHLINKPEIFDPLVKYMRSDSCDGYILVGENVVEKWRVILGATDPKEAHPDSLRGKFGNKEIIRENVAHGSDSPRNALLEIQHFFGANNG
jgi:nucleoside-diphosphate kinase